MSVLTSIAGIPLYSTIQEATAWAMAHGLSGYHTHSFQGQNGYMGGSSHSAAIQAITSAPTPTTPTTPLHRRFTTTPTTGGGGGGGY